MGEVAKILVSKGNGKKPPKPPLSYSYIYSNPISIVIFL
jgi:hypothetical protein